MKRFALLACRWAIWTNLVAVPMAFGVVIHALWNGKIPLYRAAFDLCCFAVCSTLAIALVSTGAALIEKNRCQ